MRVEQLPGLKTEALARLQAAGIISCRQLLRASQRQAQLLSLARTTELPLETLCSLVHRAELSQIRGIGPTTLAHLFEVGVVSLATLADQEPETLQAGLRQVTDRPPNLAVLEHWVFQARQHSSHRREASFQACSPP